MSERSEPHQMTKKVILDQCKRNKLYTTPSLNDVLYLHFQGFHKIENLDEYTGLKCLWLESNAISVIEGIDHQPNLKSLFLQNNLITKIENLENCRELDTLVLSHNYIKELENCCSNVLPVLNTLNISHNQLRDIEGLAILKSCNNLSVLDLSFNKIDDIMVVKVLGGMTSLHVLTMTGNPVISSITNYRKTMILECKSLTYLDSRPVFPRDRACAEAWKRGGFAAEKREHEQWNKEERRKIRKSVNSLLMKTRGESMICGSSGDEEDESSNKNDHGNVEPSQSEESAMDIYEGNQKELTEMYKSQQCEMETMTVDDGAGDFINKIAPKPIDRTALIREIQNNEKVEQKKDTFTKLLDISSDQDRVLHMLQMNKSIEENIFSGQKQNSTTAKAPLRKVLIEEMFPTEALKSTNQKRDVSFKVAIEENPTITNSAPVDESFGNEMESMLWFDDETMQSQNYEPSIDYQFNNLPEIFSETFAEDLTDGPESLNNPEDFAKVLEMCHDQKKDTMQLCFLNEHEKLMQIYDEAVDLKLIQESGVQQLAEIHEICASTEERETFASLDGILTVKKLEIPQMSDHDDDDEILQFSHIEISDVKRTAENLIEGVIRSLEDIEMTL